MDPTPVAGGGWRTLLLYGAGLLVVVGLAALLWTLLSPSGPPRMIGPRQVTTDGMGKFGLATDGKWLYYATFEGRVFQMSVAGGQASEIEPWPNEERFTFVYDINPADPTQLMVGSRTGAQWLNPLEALPLWVLSLPAGTPRRLGDARANFGVWSPDGEQLAFSGGRDVLVANGSAQSPRKMVTVDAVASVYDWSPDGKIIYGSYDFGRRNKELWEMAGDGTGRRRLLPDWPDAYVWNAHRTQDGRYLLFISGEETGGTFWAVEEGSAEPVPLGTDPLTCYYFALDPADLAAYATCVKRRSELFVYRSEIGEWAPFESPADRSAWWLTYSPDGEWVAWARYPEGTLWRSRRDGSEKLRLTEAGNLYATFPSWSLDGEHIVFGMGTMVGMVQQTFVVSRDGQGLRPLGDESTWENRAAWSPDGRVVLSFWGQKALPLRLVDLETGETEDMPGTNHLHGLAASPDGRYLAAHDRAQQQIRLLDWETRQWRTLEGALGGLPQWSADSLYLYYAPETEDIRDWYLERYRMDDGRVERVADLGSGSFTPPNYVIWWCVDPEGRVVSNRSLESWDIYAWDLELP